MDTEFAKAERNLNQVNATQQFVNKALRGQVHNKRAMKVKQFSQAEIMPMQTTESSVQHPYSQNNVPNSLNATSTLVS